MRFERVQSGLLLCVLSAVCLAVVCGCDKPAATPAVPKTVEYVTAGFDKLAGYNFEMTDDLLMQRTNVAATSTADAQIPATIKALNNQRVTLRGFMLPLKVEDGRVTELLIMKDQSMCCYGATPKINEWVSVTIKGRGVKPVMDVPVTLFGTLRVGEQRENGYLVSIYRMDGERMETEEGN